MRMRRRLWPCRRGAKSSSNSPNRDPVVGPNAPVYDLNIAADGLGGFCPVALNGLLLFSIAWVL